MIFIKNTVLLTVVLCFMMACEADRGSQDNQDNQDTRPNFTDIQGPYLGQTPPGRVPEVFAPDLLSTGEHEAGLVVCAGGDEIFFSKMTVVNNQGVATIYRTRIVDGYWTRPEVVFGSDAHNESYIAMHPDGSRLYFQSNRPVDAAESAFTWNIWYSQRLGDSWQPPVSIGRPINGGLDVSGPSVTANGTMYFTNMVLGGLNELYRSEYTGDRYEQPVRLPDSVNAAEQQFDSYIAPDESYLIFCSYNRSDTHGSTDLYVAFRDGDGNWGEGVNMGPTVNSVEGEGSASITPDGRYIFFSKYNNAENKGLDIYWVDASIIDDLH